MTGHDAGITRREFLAAAAAGTVAATTTPVRAAASPSKKLALGMDNFSIRGLEWKAPRLIEYAASLKLDSLLLSDLDVYESHDDAYLRKLEAQADRVGVAMHAGTGGICPTSARFNRKWGTAEEHLALVIRVAKALGSPVARCYLGSSQDRRGDGGIARHIESTVKVCKAVRSRALDAGVTIAIENHAGDMQAWELVELIEGAGKDYVGATIDAGNAVWALENPAVNLEILGPYAVSSGIRDSAAWETEQGAAVAWTNMGDGGVDWKAYFQRYAALCPDTPVQLEIISGAVRNLNYLDPDFWAPYPHARAREFAQFVAMAKGGQRYTPPADRPAGPRSPALTRRQQRYDLERSVVYCRTVLGLGRR